MYNLYERRNNEYYCLGRNLSMYDCMVLAQITRNERKGKCKLFYDTVSRPGEFYKLY